MGLYFTNKKLKGDFSKPLNGGYYQTKKVFSSFLPEGTVLATLNSQKPTTLTIPNLSKVMTGIQITFPSLYTYDGSGHSRDLSKDDAQNYQVTSPILIPKTKFNGTKTQYATGVGRGNTTGVGSSVVEEDILYVSVDSTTNQVSFTSTGTTYANAYGNGFLWGYLGPGNWVYYYALVVGVITAY